jgi:membrane fusion protein (multidrug efflux system)
MTKNSRRVVSILIIPVLIIVAGYFGYRHFKQPAENKSAAPAAASGKPPQAFAMPVVAIKINEENLSEEISAVGTLEANQIATVRAEISGKVTKIDFAEGKFIKKGQLIAKINDSNYKADYELAKANNKRAKLLFKVGAISKEEMETAKSSYDLTKSKMDKTTINAPFGGEISFRNINVGDLVAEGTEITRIADVSKIKVQFAVAEKYLSKLKIGQVIYLKVDAYSGQEFTGSILAIDPVTDADTRTIGVKAIIGNKSQKLEPGMTAYVQVKLRNKANAILIPEEAIISGDDKTSVFKIIEGTAKASEVVIGERLDGKVEINSGINAGDEIIIAGHMKIRDGMPVANQKVAE